MRTLQELAVANATTTGSTGISTITPEVWSMQVEQAAQELRVARNYVRVYTDLLGKGGDVLHVPRGGTLTASATTQATDITLTEISTYDTVDFTPVEYGCAAGIGREVVERQQFDILKDVTTQIGRALAQKEDSDILTTMAANAPATNQNAVYCGTGNTVIADLADGDIISIDKFADAITENRIDSYQPDVCFIHPKQENVFIKDGAFVNASEYGSDTVVQKGLLGQYLGIKIVTTPNVKANTAGSGGHNAVLFDNLAPAAGLAVKRNATIETKYEPLNRLHYIVGTISYHAALVQPKASCIIYSTDA
jgi:N4-gp56 family major capsid protein